MSHVHLIVLQHGLWGSPADVENLTEYLREALQKQGQSAEELALLASGVNARRLTYDGIDVCGSRLAQLVQDTIQQYAEQGKQVTKLSLIGYSLGGVINRFAAGKLYVAGVFEKVQPMNLITIASPHLGSFREPSGLWARFFNSQVPIIASRTGRQLMLVDSDYSVPWLTHQQELHNKAHRNHTLHKASHPQQQQEQEQQEEGSPQEQQQDGDSQHQQGNGTNKSSSETGMNQLLQQQQQRRQRGAVVLPPGVEPSQPVPLLLLMSHPAGPFWRALKHFKTRICAANIRYDSMVPYCTAALCVANPYEQAQPIPINADKYPSVVRPAQPQEEQHITPVPIRGRSRLLYFYVFLPMFPFLWAYSAINGILHHRQAKQRPLDLTWLQQYSADHNPFSRQPSRQASIKLKHNRRHQQQWQRQQWQQRANAAAELLEAEAAETQQGTAAAPTAAGAGNSGLLLLPGSRTTFTGGNINTAPAAAVGALGQASPFHFAAITSEQQQQQNASKGASTAQAAAEAAEAAPKASAAASLEQALTCEGVLEHEGIIEEPYAVHQQQQWMAKQLYDELPPCWVPERVSSSSSKCLPHDTEASTASAAASSSSSSVVAVTHTSAAGVQKRTEAQSILTIKPTIAEASSSDNKQQQQQQQQQVGNSSSGGDSQCHSPVAVAPPDANCSSSGFISEGGWHRVDVWMGHMHAHAAIVIRDRRFEGESRDFFQYLADHIHL